MKNDWNTGTMYSASKCTRPEASQCCSRKMVQNMPMRITYVNTNTIWLSPWKVVLRISAVLFASVTVCAPNVPGTNTHTHTHTGAQPDGPVLVFGRSIGSVCAIHLAHKFPDVVSVRPTFLPNALAHAPLHPTSV